MSGLVNVPALSQAADAVDAAEYHNLEMHQSEKVNATVVQSAPFDSVLSPKVSM
jgi:hypothetical protein